MRDNDEHVTPCPDKSYCCGIVNTDCCKQGKGVFIDKNGLVTTVNPNSTESSSANTTSSDSKNTTSIITPPPAPSGIGGGAIAGIVIGVVAGLAVIVAAVGYFARRKRTRTKDGKTYDSTPAPDETKTETGPLPQKHSEQFTTELDGTAQLHELSVPPNVPHELPGSGGYREML